MQKAEPSKPARPGKREKARRTLALNPDVLGLLVAAFLATAVMAVCFLYRQAGGFTVALRVAVVFLVTYVVTFLFVWFLQRVTAGELNARPKQQKQTPAPEAPEDNGKATAEPTEKG